MMIVSLVTLNVVALLEGNTDITKSPIAQSPVNGGAVILHSIIICMSTNVHMDISGMGGVVASPAPNVGTTDPEL